MKILVLFLISMTMISSACSREAPEKISKNLEKSDLIREKTIDSFSLFGGAHVDRAFSVKLELPYETCSGTFISTHVILTASHCLHRLPHDGLTVNAIIWNFDKTIFLPIYSEKEFVIDHVIDSDYYEDIILQDGNVDIQQLTDQRDLAFIFIRNGSTAKEVRETMKWKDTNLIGPHRGVIKFGNPTAGQKIYIEGWGVPDEQNGIFAYCSSKSGSHECISDFSPTNVQNTPTTYDDNWVKQTTLNVQLIGKSIQTPYLGYTNMFSTETPLQEVPAPVEGDFTKTKIPMPVFGNVENGMLYRGDSGSAAFGSDLYTIYGVFSGFEYRINDTVRWFNTFSTVDNDWYQKNVRQRSVVDYFPATAKFRKAFILYGTNTGNIAKLVKDEESPQIILTRCLDVSLGNEPRPEIKEEYEQLKDYGMGEGTDFNCFIGIGSPGVANNIELNKTEPTPQGKTLTQKISITLVP